ncbi:MAG: RNA 2'-phosphotransferase [Candidatus Thiothrix singaporensis]|uniref:Probable RNA 2'-phosphotransferase n=1 Tax=Candidatus Thiothrix singaporensis TaxID=2799669 RepID=A0A7L6AVX6_9GAMM|nr:MAG: RNA 2'-phosphotransferase [Candidatus Thiothrix singaporensis]
MDQKRKIQIGKFISLVLRHEPQKIGLVLDESGWASVDGLLAGLASKGKKLSFAELEEIVVTNDKQRYSFNEDKTRIRANQGHSLELDLQLEPQTPPDVLYHGTATRFMPSINQQGLQKRNRHHVHLSADRETALKVGSRHGTPVVLVIDAAAMQVDGCLFYCNGVWLTDTVAPHYFSPEVQLQE